MPDAPPGAARGDSLRFDDLLHVLFDSLDDAEPWTRFLSALCEQVRGQAATLVLRQPELGDRGDLFETRTFDLTEDQGAFSAALDEVQADGGGDTPEDLNAGLRDALDKQSWRGDDAVKLVFVVADAPPHLDYADSTSYATTVVDAAARGIKILPIGASGLDPQGEYVMRQLAQVTLGRFVFLTYGVDGASPGDSTPMSVERDQYSVLPLDELVVQLVADELEPLR